MPIFSYNILALGYSRLPTWDPPLDPAGTSAPRTPSQSHTFRYATIFQLLVSPTFPTGDPPLNPAGDGVSASQTPSQLPLLDWVTPLLFCLCRIEKTLWGSSSRYGGISQPRRRRWLTTVPGRDFDRQVVDVVATAKYFVHSQLSHACETNNEWYQRNGLSGLLVSKITNHGRR